ncbi:hypothetical protein HYALB_00006098 [Hymenoscyphus albidus]|uniref:Uncharacterized protein n=1 Tax=Hymenoscyphus albidus TaxID=595503 RepID=A0A9N9Q7R3_9HELO|nr:hypothetical protein HYALB_00006098 [Hymenoscyphus albidus]
MPSHQTNKSFQKPIPNASQSMNPLPPSNTVQPLMHIPPQVTTSPTWLRQAPHNQSLRFTKCPVTKRTSRKGNAAGNWIIVIALKEGRNVKA